MKKSTINLVSSLKEKLLEFPILVNSLDKKEFSFLTNLLTWIKTSEEILTDYNISEVSSLSGLRGKIIAPKFSTTKASSIKKLQLQAASEVLFELQHVVLNVLIPMESKIEECRALTRQLLLLVSQTQTIKYNKTLPFDHLVNEIWAFIASNEQLKAGAIKLKTSLIISDIRILIAEEINLDDF